MSLWMFLEKIFGFLCILGTAKGFSFSGMLLFAFEIGQQDHGEWYEDLHIIPLTQLERVTKADTCRLDFSSGFLQITNVPGHERSNAFITSCLGKLQGLIESFSSRFILILHLIDQPAIERGFAPA